MCIHRPLSPTPLPPLSPMASPPQNKPVIAPSHHPHAMVQTHVIICLGSNRSLCPISAVALLSSPTCPSPAAPSSLCNTSFRSTDTLQWVFLAVASLPAFEHISFQPLCSLQPAMLSCLHLSVAASCSTLSCLHTCPFLSLEQTSVQPPYSTPHHRQFLLTRLPFPPQYSSQIAPPLGSP